jgi:histidyl-tRNA synthetase
MPGSIASGGRYDRLIAALGGPDVPACGGSLGVERIIGLLSDEKVTAPRLDVAVTVIDDDAAADAMDFAARLRRAGLRTEVYLGSSRKLARQLKWAADRHARFALIYGPQERAAGLVTVRDMDSGEQQQVPPDQLTVRLAAPR